MLTIARRRLLAAAPALAAIGTFGWQREAQARTFVRIATAGSGGNYYRLGAGMAALWNDEVPDVQASIQATKGSPHNMELLADKEVEIAFVTASVAYDAVHNQGQWADKPAGRYGNAMHVSTVYPNPVWFVAMEWAPEINSLRDLKGKRVSVGLLGSQGESVWRRIMEITGLTYDDIQPEYTVHQDGIDQVRNRQVDAVVWPDAAGSASITQIMDTGFGRLLAMDEDVIAAMTEHSLDYPYTIPADAMPGQTEAVETWASAALLMSRSGVAEDLVYDLTRAMYEGREQLIGVHPIAAYMVPEQALASQVGDVHPGAARYYREIGVLS
jgi:TRAP transporter TAXI family solute receptor